MAKRKRGWSTRDSADLYGFGNWGRDHFTVDANGDVVAHPAGDHRTVRIRDVVEEARAAGLSAPLVIRFQDLLRKRVEQLNQAFAQAIEAFDYPKPYQGVFPIKVNQLREVVEEILDAGRAFSFGLECGSKPELLVALALHDDPNSLIVCNGYKDEEFVRLALAGSKLGKKVVIVIEQLAEVDLVIRLVKKEKAHPIIGLRAKLSSSGEGKWAESAGEGAKFGLTAPEIVRAAQELDAAGLKGLLGMIHFHVGSQVPNITTIKGALTEASRIYCELCRMGFPLGYLDVGGGLGVDYDGSKSNFESSMNYSLEYYARDIIHIIKETCDATDVEPPTIVSESGRAIVAPHSVLVVEAVEQVSVYEMLEPGGSRRSTIQYEPSEDEPQVLKDLRRILKNADKLNALPRFHDANQKKDEAYDLFSLGYLGLIERAEAEILYWKILVDIHENFGTDTYMPDELKELDARLADQYVCNFSVFQSLIDHWACDQLFPIAPLQRLNERPDVKGTLVDITCDSEGEISRFVDLQDDYREVLPLHDLRENESYYLGVFLVGAYQDIMGDLHNLFGRVDEVHVFLEEDEEDGYYIEETIKGSAVRDILRFIQHDGRELSRLMKRQIDAATKADRVKPREGVRIINFYEKLLDGKTYLHTD